MENNIGGTDLMARFQYAKGLLARTSASTMYSITVILSTLWDNNSKGLQGQ